MDKKQLPIANLYHLRFPLESVQRQTNLKSFAVASVLLIAAFFAFVLMVLVHCPKAVDAFLNSDNPVQSGRLVAQQPLKP